MILKNIDKTKPLKLFINKVEMDFSNNISFYNHPTNFSSMTFSDVIPKEKNKYPLNTKIENFSDDFSVAEVYSGDKLIFFGLVNSSGRFNLFPWELKTKSVEISDYRKWLSLKKPVEKLFINVSPTEFVTELVNAVNEPRLKVGKLSFTDNTNIEIYSTANKTLYQIFKEVIASLTDSLFYLTISENGDLLINYKSNFDFENEINPFILDLDNPEILENYKITNLELDSNVDNYTNYVNFESDSVISNVLISENFTITNENKFTTIYNIGKVSSEIGRTFLLDEKNQKFKTIVVNNDNKKDNQYYDILYTPKKNTFEINKKFLNLNYRLAISYYPQEKITISLKNQNEIDRIKKISQTSGDVFLYEKSNDYTELEQVFKDANHILNIQSKPKKTITVTCENPIWNVADLVTVKHSDLEIAGNYLVVSVSGEIQASTIDNVKNNFWLAEYVYEIQNSTDTDTYLNQFDNQSYRTEKQENITFIEKTESFTETAIINFYYEISTIDDNGLSVIIGEN